MKEKNYSWGKLFSVLRCTCRIATLIVPLLVLSAHPAKGIDLCLGEKKISVMGYANQGVSFGVAGNEFDTKQGFQQALCQLLLEAKCNLNSELRFFGSIKMNADWAYPILSSNDEWDDKDFDDSRDDLFIYSHRRDIIQEMHLTWTPGNWFFRAGKQIVVWGETDGFRLMDQINPLDQRRGMTDVEFETTILPLWLLRAEYYMQPQSAWLTDLGFEFIFNPNADFRGDESIELGNDKGGIWAPGIKIRLPRLWIFPRGYMHLGSMDKIVRKPDSFDDDGFEYGFRIRSVMWDTIVTFNFFYGRDNIPALSASPNPPRLERSDADGRQILHPAMEGYYPLMRYAGFTLTRDFENLYITSLGGIAPVLRVEAFYAFENTFESAPINGFKKFDEVRYAIGIDWRVKLWFLNERDAFMVSPQFFHRKVLNYPNYTLTQNGGINVRDDNYATSLMIQTTYFHNKIIPMVFWLRDITEEANLFKIQVGYERSDAWNYTLGVLLLNGAKTGDGFQALTNKDQIYFTVAYRFS